MMELRDLRGEHVGHLGRPRQRRHVHELAGHLREHGLSVQRDAIEPLHVLGVGEKEAPTVAPAGHRDALLQERIQIVKASGIRGLDEDDRPGKAP